MSFIDGVELEEEEAFDFPLISGSGVCTDFPSLSVTDATFFAAKGTDEATFGTEGVED